MNKINNHKDSPFIESFEQLISKIREDLQNEEKITSLYIADDNPEAKLEGLLVQPLYRIIEGREVTFLAIRNVVLKEEFKGKGLFTQFVEELETLKIPLLFHDIVNEKLIPFFSKRGYKKLKEIKNEEKIISMYRL